MAGAVKQTDGWEIINLGANGREIPGNTDSLLWIKKHTPVDLILVMLGTNDLLQGATAAETAVRMEAFLNSVLPYFKAILPIAPPPTKHGAWVATDALVDQSYRLNEEYRLLAEKMNVPFLNTQSWSINRCFDGVHFTEDGHHSFAEHLIEHLK